MSLRSTLTFVGAHKLPTTLAVLALAAGSTTAAVTLAPSGPSGVQPPTQVAVTYANGTATVTWQAPTSGAAISGYRVTLKPNYNDHLPQPNLGPNHGTVVRDVLAFSHSATFTGLLEDCHQRYRISVETLSPTSHSNQVVSQSFRPSGIVAQDKAPPYVVVLVDGIASQQPGFTLKNVYSPLTVGSGPPSYCPESWTSNLQPRPGVVVSASGEGGEAEASFMGSPNGPWSFFHKWNHGETDANGQPTTGDSGGPDLTYASEPKQLNGDGQPDSFTHAFMLDDIAARGAVILPFSYHNTISCSSPVWMTKPDTGATLTSSNRQAGGQVSFNFPAYTKDESSPLPQSLSKLADPCVGTIPFYARLLYNEIQSIHQVWPSSKLVVMGHSQGGLVVLRAWQYNFGYCAVEDDNCSAPDNWQLDRNVTAFSLDSPVNGAGFCIQPAGCLPATYPDFALRGTYDEGSGGYLGMDQARDNNFHFVGTYGDSPAIPVKLPITPTLATIHSYGQGSVTLEHQLPFWYSTTNPPTSGSYTSDYIESNCNVGAQAFVNPKICPAPDPPDHISRCSVDYYGVAQWITDTGHFVVKYCPDDVQYFNHTLGLAPAPAPTPSPSPSPSVGWSCTTATFMQVLKNPYEMPMPVGNPKCLDGYAEQTVANYKGGPQAPVFFVFQAGKWSTIPGTNTIAGACAAIPNQVMSAWGYDCSSPSPSPTASSGGSFTAGHDTPQDAVYGLLSAEKAGNWSGTGGVCSYLAPDEQDICLGASPETASGNFQVHAAVIRGTQALVEVTGSISAGGHSASNSDPATGMPPGGGSFASVWNYAATSTNYFLSPAACEQVGGQWYVVQGG